MKISWKIRSIIQFLGILATTLAAPNSPDHNHVYGFSYHQDFEVKNKSGNKVEKYASIDGKLFYRYDPPENRIIFGFRDFVLHTTAPGKEAKDIPIDSTDFYVNYNDDKGLLETVQTTEQGVDTIAMYFLMGSVFQLNEKDRGLDTTAAHEYRTPWTYGHGKCDAHYIVTPTSDGFKLSKSFNASDCEWDFTKIDPAKVDNPPKTSASTTFTFKDTHTVESSQVPEIESVTVHELVSSVYTIKQHFTEINKSEFDEYHEEEKIMEKKWPVSGDIADDYVTFMTATLNEKN